MVEIILIGGASGTAKTYTAKKLSASLNFHHTLGSGFVRQICRNFITPLENPYLHTYSFDCSYELTGYDLLRAQSKPLVKPIQSCIKRARDEGTKIIIEGVNILPCLYSEIDADLKFILTNKIEDEHRKMVYGESHSRRVILDNDFKKSREIQDCFIQDAIKNQWDLLDCSNAFYNIEQKLKSL